MYIKIFCYFYLINQISRRGEDHVFNHGGTSYIITNIGKQTLIAIKDLTEAGAEIRHLDISILRRSVIYDDNVAYFSITEPLITKSATENVDQAEGEDLWVGSTEVSVTISQKTFFVRLVGLDGSIASEFKICTIAICLQNFVILRINIVSIRNMFSSSIGRPP